MTLRKGFLSSLEFYLAVPGFSCSMRGLHCGRKALSCSMHSLVPQQGLNLGPLHWECGVPTTGPPENSLTNDFLNMTAKAPSEEKNKLDIITI